MKSSDSFQKEYIGDELSLFENAINWKKYFSSKIKEFVKGDVLEVGAGIGINAEYLINSSVNSWCFLEPDINMTKQITINTKNLKLNNKRIINGCIDQIIDQKFDTIIYIDVMEHIENPMVEIEKAKSRLNKKGNLIILVPAFNFLYSDFDKRIGHYRRYNKTMLKNEINGILSKKKLFYLDSIGFFASLANRVILKKSLPTINNIMLWDRLLVKLSKISDVLFLNFFGKSLIGIYTKKD
jgi:SAM-dependent methyltransferase